MVDLTPEQHKLLAGTYAAGPLPSGDQTPDQAENLAVDGFIAGCQLFGIEPIPSAAAVREALRAHTT